MVPGSTKPPKRSEVKAARSQSSRAAAGRKTSKTKPVSETKAILDLVTEMSGRLSRMEARLDSMDTRLGTLEGKVSSIDDRVSSIETDLEEKGLREVTGNKASVEYWERRLKAGPPARQPGRMSSAGLSLTGPVPVGRNQSSYRETE